MPLFELRTRETIEAVYEVDAATEDDAIECLNRRNVRAIRAGLISSDLSILELSDKKVALPPCA
jgi:hypothetical protein